MKKKIPLAVSIDEDLADWISKGIEGSEFRNRSHMIEYIINEYKKKKEEDEKNRESIK